MKLQSFLMVELDKILGDKSGKLVQTRGYGEVTFKVSSYITIPRRSGTAKLAFRDIRNTYYSFYFAVDTVSILFTPDSSEFRDYVLSELFDIYGVNKKEQAVF